MTHSKRSIPLWLVTLALSSTLGFNFRASAQTASGIISGVVQDESGAVVPGANVTVTNVETGISRSVSSDSAGRYRVPGLIPDHYEVQAQVTGFQTELRKGIELTVGSEAVINLMLKVGQVAEKTVVTAEAPLVETTTSTLSSLVSQDTIRELPLNGRSFDQLISLDSSMPTNYSRGASKPSGPAQAFSVNGARTQANMFLLDGTQMMGSGQQNTEPGGVLGKMLGVDAVQEFSVLSSNSSAAYGKRAGGIVNIVTRSGTNQLHGSAFEFLRNSALDARNFFDLDPNHPLQRSSPPPFKRNQYGGSIGGPIRKDRTFFFGNYEGLREDLGLSSVTIVPDNIVRQSAAPAVKPYLVLFPPVNGRTFAGGTGEYLSSPNEPSRQNFFLTRVDHKISDRDSLFGRYYFSQAHEDIPQPNPVFSEVDDSRDQILTLEEKRIYPKTLNVVRFGFSRAHLFGTGLPAIPLDPALRFLAGAETVGQINFTTSNSGASITRAGINSAVNRGSTVNQFDFGDQVFLYRGAHSLQLGVDVQRIQHNDSDSVDTRGNFLFSDLQHFLQGQPTRFSAPAPGGDLHRAWRLTYFGPFFQDDYKLRRNLTLNLGLRYELMTVPTEASGNRISNFRTHLENGLAVIDSSPTLGSPFFKSNHNLFAPRIGFAWDPHADGKMAIRAGFGMFYDLLESEFRFFAGGNPPFFADLQVNNPPFPLGFSGGTGSAPQVVAQGLDFNLDEPTRLQYNLSVQREITSSTLFTVGYVGSHSYHLTRVRDSNTARFQLQPDGTKFYPAGALRLNPSLASSRIVTTEANSYYNSLQLDFTQRLSHGLRYKISYSFAKNIDETSTVISDQGTGTPQVSQDPNNLKADRGLATYDVRNALVMNFTYDVPWKSTAGVAGKFLGGWQFGTIASLIAGQPFTAATGFNQSRDGQNTIADRPNLRPGAKQNPILGGPDKYFDPTVFALQPAGTYGNLGRTTLIGPGLANVDLNLVKITPVNERLKLDFRAEFFNVINHANFALPNSQIFNTAGQILGSAGRITATKTTSRQLQFALKLMF